MVLQSGTLMNGLNTKNFDDLFPKVQLVVHAGAITNSSFKSQPDKCLFHLNVLSCFNLGQWALERNIPLVYISLELYLRKSF